jgi:hypothetical protein
MVMYTDALLKYLAGVCPLKRCSVEVQRLCISLTVGCRGGLSIQVSRRQEDSDEEGLDDGPAAFFLKSDAQRRFEESRRLTILSEHTEPSSAPGDDVRSQAGSSSKFRLEQPNLSALNIVEPGVWMGQNASRRSVYSPAPESQNPFGDGDGVGEAGPSRIAAGSFFPAELLRSQPRPEGTLPANADGSLVSNTAELCQHPFTTVMNPDSQPHSLLTPPVPAMTRASSSSPVHLSPVQEVDSSRGLLPTSSHASPLVSMQTESEKPPSVSPSAVSPPSV